MCSDLSVGPLVTLTHGFSCLQTVSHIFTCCYQLSNWHPVGVTAQWPVEHIENKNMQAKPIMYVMGAGVLLSTIPWPRHVYIWRSPDRRCLTAKRLKNQFYSLYMIVQPFFWTEVYSVCSHKFLQNTHKTNCSVTVHCNDTCSFQNVNVRKIVTLTNYKIA